MAIQLKAIRLDTIFQNICQRSVLNSQRFIQRTDFFDTLELRQLNLKSGVFDVDVLIESTNAFEKDLVKLSESDKRMAIQSINDCADLFPIQKAEAYRKLRCLPLPSVSNGYESSLYTLRISEELRIILTVDEDPIFGQVIFTLFRVVKHDDFDKAHKGVAESLYQELLHQDRLTVQVS